MNSIVEKRKQNWVDFYDITSPVNRLLVVDYTKDFPQRPAAMVGNAEGTGRMGVSKIHDAVGKYGKAE